MNRTERAVQLFRDGYTCSQAIVAAFGPSYGVDAAVGVRLAEGFGGGIAGTGGICSAITGATMVLGLRYGRTQPEDPAATERTNALIRDFERRFQAQCGSLYCQDLLGCRIDTPAKREMARQRGLFGAICPRVVRAAAEILEELLAAEQPAAVSATAVANA